MIYLQYIREIKIIDYSLGKATAKKSYAPNPIAYSRINSRATSGFVRNYPETIILEETGTCIKSSRKKSLPPKSPVLL
jgi:hypothetical protein